MQLNVNPKLHLANLKSEINFMQPKRFIEEETRNINSLKIICW